MVSRHNKLHPFFVVVIIFLVTGCSRGLKKEELLEARFYFNRGMERMKKKDYVKAVTDFQTVVESFSTSAIVDHAQFMLGEARFKSEEYILAAYEYERVYVDYPSSNFAPEAQYKKALCYFMESPKAALDQENTLLAIDEFNRFIDNYPQNPFVKEAQKKIDELTEKLARKEYLNAEQYKKMKFYDAALIYYNSVITDYPRTIWADYSRFGIGEVFFKEKEYEKAKEAFIIIVNGDVDPELQKKASEMLDKIEKIEKKSK